VPASSAPRKAPGQLSGDEIFFGLRIAPEGAVVKVKLMSY